LFCGHITYSQSNGKVIGKVIDAASRQPIGYAPVTVIAKQSGKVVSGALTDSTGSFGVSGLSEGVYRVTIEFLGYRKSIFDSVWLRSNKSVADLGNVRLSASGQSLQEVTVTASAPIIENKIDKMVYNAANDITSQGGVALDILKKVPQVNVDIDGNVELQGNSNIRFLINGKPSSVFGSSVTDALAAIPASQVKSIEVITSPGAKYDAQGTGGIINIILKDNKMQGINGSINLSAGTRLENGSANLNFRRNNIGINVFFSGNAQLSSSTPTTQDRSSFDSIAKVTDHLIQGAYTDFTRSSYQSGIGFDWAVTKKDNITVALSYNHFGNQSNSNTHIQKDTLGALMPPVISTRSSVNKFETNSLDWSLGYKKMFNKEGQELDLIYSASYGVPVTGYQQGATYDGAVLPYVGARSNNPGTNMENDISLDYAHPLTQHFILETGVKTVLTGITSSADVDTLQQATQDYLRDQGQSYKFNYDMQVYAAYLSASFPLTGYLKVKAGMRYEYTATRINNANSDAQTYGTLVPSVTISHDIDKKQFIKLSYTRRIERPDYRDVNPFLNLSDPYNITTGNPQLRPEIANNCELGYNRSFGRNGNLYIALIERINTDDHKPITLFYPVYDSVYKNVSVTNWQNIGVEYNTGLNISGSWSLKDKLSLRGNGFVVYRYIVNDFPGAADITGARFRINLNAGYQLPHDLITEVFGNYNSATKNIQGTTPQSATYTIAFRKQFWHKNASFGLTATNIFNEYTRQVTTVQTGTYSSYNVRMLPYRSVGISLTYKFGKLEFKKNKEDDSYLNNPPVMGN
jgi:outer membrane receptor protein involved in Fe transport